MPPNNNDPPIADAAPGRWNASVHDPEAHFLPRLRQLQKLGHELVGAIDRGILDEGTYLNFLEIGNNLELDLALAMAATDKQLDEIEKNQ